MPDETVDADVPTVALCCVSSDTAQRTAVLLRSPAYRLLPVGRKALDRLKDTERPDVIALDGADDETGALDLCRRQADTPVVALLSPAQPGAVARAREAGAAEVIMAPALPCEFALRVRAVHRLHRLRSANENPSLPQNEDA